MLQFLRKYNSQPHRGIIGIIFGLVVSYVVSYVLTWPFIVSSTAVVISFFVCAATGIFFGWYPAKKAASRPL